MNKKQQGFTLVELAIVLVIIGFILGMAFKGKDLIDGAKVKNMQAQYNKVIAGFNIFYERYQFYPGDGCTTATPTNVAVDCPSTGRNGLLNTPNERQAAIALLQSTGILSQSDLQSVFGRTWGISYGGFQNNVNFLTLNTNGGAAQGAADYRYVCALDRQMDDGVATTGSVRSNGAYTMASDCWNPPATQGLVTIGIRLLP